MPPKPYFAAPKPQSTVPKPQPPVRSPQVPLGPATEWGQEAAWYDQLVGEHGSEYHQKVVLPGTLRLLALQAGQKALDVACGQGVLCRLLHENGIIATGLDSAMPLLKLARQRSDPAIQYIKADAHELASYVGAEHFDAAACILAIQNIDPINQIFAGVARALVPMGRFVMVMMHPCFRSPKATSWGFDAANDLQYRRVDRYLLPRREPIVTHPGKDPHRYTWTYHRPVQAYVSALRNCGMVIDTIEEWPSHKVSEPGPRASAENTARKEIPMFMAIRAIKQ